MRELRPRDWKLLHWWQAEFPVQDLRLYIMHFFSYTDVVYAPGTCFGILQYYEKGTILLEAQILDIKRMISFGLPLTTVPSALILLGIASSLPYEASFFLWATSALQSFGIKNYGPRPAPLCFPLKPCSCHSGHVGRVYPSSLGLQVFALSLACSFSVMGRASLVPSTISCFAPTWFPNPLVC